MKTVTLTDFLTKKQIDQALKLYDEAEPGTFAKRCAAEIIEPALLEINRKLGQENDAHYLAYCCEAVILKVNEQLNPRNWK